MLPRTGSHRYTGRETTPFRSQKRAEKRDQTNEARQTRRTCVFLGNKSSSADAALTLARNSFDVTFAGNYEWGSNIPSELADAFEMHPDYAFSFLSPLLLP